MYDYFIRHHTEQQESRVVVRTIYQHNNRPYPYDSLCFWPVETKVLNSDAIRFDAIDSVEIDGTDLIYQDKYVNDTDTKIDDKETELQVASIPPIHGKVEVGVLEFEMSLKSTIFPKVALYNFAITFVCDKNIFDPSYIKSTSVWFHKNIGLNLIGEVLNIYRGVHHRNDNWYQLRFSQLISVIDPSVEIKFGVQINKSRAGLTAGYGMDITFIASWIDSLTQLLRVSPGDEVVGLSMVAADGTSVSSLDESPSSSFDTLVIDVVDHRI